MKKSESNKIKTFSIKKLNKDENKDGRLYSGDPSKTSSDKCPEWVRQSLIRAGHNPDDFESLEEALDIWD